VSAGELRELRRPREPVTAWSIDYDCRLALGFGFLFEYGEAFGFPRPVTWTKLCHPSRKNGQRRRYGFAELAMRW
jgi:hypothetical protein